MPTLTPPDHIYVADQGHVSFSVAPGPFGDAELFEREVPFSATAAPPYRRVPGVLTGEEAVTHPFTAQRGSLYQARLYQRGDIARGQVPADTDTEPRPIGALDIPCVLVESRNHMLTQCGNVARARAPINLEVGGNYLRVSLATGHGDSRLLLLVGGVEPTEINTGHGSVPAFVDNDPLVFASSPRSSRLHRVVAPSNDHFTNIGKLVPELPIWYIAIAWQADGTWDYVWNDHGISGRRSGSGQPDAPPQPLTTKTRQISLNVQQLTCVNDSAYDDDTDPATFTLALQDSDGNALASNTYDWNDMSSGDVVQPRLSLDWSGGAKSEGAKIWIGAADNWNGTKPVPLPVGEGSLRSTNTLRIKQSALDPPAGFYADLTTTVAYTD